MQNRRVLPHGDGERGDIRCRRLSVTEGYSGKCHPGKRFRVTGLRDSLRMPGAQWLRKKQLVPETDISGEEPEDRCFRLPLRGQCCGRGGCFPAERICGNPGRGGLCGGKPVRMLPRQPGKDQGDDPRAPVEPRRHGRLYTRGLTNPSFKRPYGKRVSIDAFSKWPT